MDRQELLMCIHFFKELQVVETDVTTLEEAADHRRAITVNYRYKGRSYTTKRLYYKNILHQKNVKNPKVITNYFGGDVYWLDIDHHQWPQDGTDAELEQIVIDDMINGDDQGFRTLLKEVANNRKTGQIQRITAEGKSGQYHHNFENNNHWHDIILLLQAIIENQGRKVDKRHFSRLVFRWDGNKNTSRERSSLAKEVGWKSRAFIDKVYHNVMTIQNTLTEMEIFNILKQKGQVILQGPPGTGKTHAAKMIGRELVQPLSLSVDDIRKALTVGCKFKSATDYTEYEISKIDDGKVSVKLKNGGEYAPSFREIISAYEKRLWQGGQIGGNDPYSAAIAKYMFENMDCSQYLKLIQFHPAYSYEDFVRGIVAESRGEQIDYKTKDKLLGHFAKTAFKNYHDSKKSPSEFSHEQWLEEVFSLFVESIEEDLESKEKIDLTTKVSIIDSEDGAFRYKGREGWSKLGNRMLYRDIKKAYLDGNTERQHIKKNSSLSGLARHHASYYIRLLELFRQFLSTNKYTFDPKTDKREVMRNYVLIIDEINRANLPAVLGELIYALEYRGEKVESMYTIDDDNTLVIPPNLFIIGTMNTSDRSVGHIDYAIRRRFAFIELLPKVLNEEGFEVELFKRVSALFIKNFDAYAANNAIPLEKSEHLSEEFRPEDVWLGHSYFMKKDGDFALRKKFEILPILREYVNDGILKQSAEKVINEL